MSGASRGRWWLVALPVLAALLSSCLSVPTDGPVEAGQPPSSAPSGPVEIEPEPPAAGASPQLVVEGFLHAMADYRTEYSVAREYLSEDVRDQWRPEQAVLVYGEASPVGNGTSVVLDAPLVGVVGPDGAYTHSDSRYRIDFEMEQDAQGQWRIGNPPPGLLVSQYLFERFYNGFDVFFFDPTFTTVVPDPIYVARGQQSATTLVEALLDGPTEWLEPAVVSALPAQTQLGLSIPTTAEGVAEVSLNDAVNQLTAEQRSRMAAQVVWTLRQLPQTTAVRFLVDGAPYVVPGQRADGTVSVDAYEHLAPVPAGLSSQLYLARAEGVSRLVEVQGSLQPVPVEGPLGTLGRGVASMAVAPTPGGEVAVVSEDRTRVDVAETLPGAPLTTVLSGAEGLLTPQFSRDHDLWLVERRRGSSQLHVVVDGELRPVRAPELEDSEVVAFRISPDGTRMAVVRRVDGGTELGLALVRRGEEVGVDSYRSIPLVSATGRELTVVQDVEWADATTFMLLARSDADRQSLPWLVDQDGAEMQQVGSGGWSPDSLQVSPSPTNPRAAAVGPDGQLWLHQGDYRWPEVLSEVTAAAYPG